MDETAVASDAGGEGDEPLDTGLRGPRQPPGQQLASLAAFDPEHLAQLLFEQIRLVEHLVVHAITADRLLSYDELVRPHQGPRRSAQRLPP